MLLELDEDFKELIFQEIEELSLSYITYKVLTDGDNCSSRLDGETYEMNGNNFGVIIRRISRTKISFSFRFVHHEREWAIKLIRILEGIVNYKFNNNGNAYGTNYFYVGFQLDIGAKKDCKEFFQRLFGETLF